MPVFVHLTSEKNGKRIVRNGIKVCKVGSNIPDGVYCMPVMQDYYISHQWLRELKRQGHNTIIGIYFRIPDGEPVWFGKYNADHIRMNAGAAIKAIMDADNQEGFEVIVPRGILAKEIIRTKHIRQIVGWRYYPGAHGRQCLCPVCIGDGARAKRLRQDRKNDR